MNFAPHSRKYWAVSRISHVPGRCLESSKKFCGLAAIPIAIVNYSVWDKPLVVVPALNQILYVIYLTKVVGVFEERAGGV
jgi:hypothetical protein